MWPTPPLAAEGGASVNAVTSPGQIDGVDLAGAPTRPVEDSRVPVAPIAFLAAVVAVAVLAFTVIVTGGSASVPAVPASQGPTNPPAGATAEDDDEGDRDGGDGDGEGNGDGNGDGDGNSDSSDGDADGEASDASDEGSNSGGDDAIAPDRGFPGDPSSDELADWDKGFSGYTVVIGSAATKGDAKDRARDAARDGLPAGVLEADEHLGLEEDGPWVVFAGRFDSERDARESQSAFSSRGFPGQVRLVSARAGGSDSEEAADEASDD